MKSKTFLLILFLGIWVLGLSQPVLAKNIDKPDNTEIQNPSEDKPKKEEKLKTKKSHKKKYKPGPIVGHPGEECGGG
ncbi:MAG: hypothetical protein HYU97_07495 [Deltaproteobacteria bacterium]|nr:hypothetical protein [Deltaproteobacteria bacterium]